MNGNSSLKHHIKNALTKNGLLRLVARFASQRIVILKYHSIQDEPERYENSIGSGIIHGRAVFAEQMELVARKFDPVTLDDVLLFLRGDKRLPRRPVAVTFDDGYADNSELAAPILNSLGVPAAFYVTVSAVDLVRAPWFCRLRHAFGKTAKKTWTDSTEGCVRDLVEPRTRKVAFLIAAGRCASSTGETQEKHIRKLEEELEVEPLSPRDVRMMNWEQVRCLRRSGHIVGSHTLTHPNAAQVAIAEFQKECVESKRRLEEELGSPVPHFSYPSPILQPHWTEQTVEVTKEAGYQTAVTSMAGPVQFGNNPLALQRVAVPHDKEEFLWKLECTFLGRRT
ncbi:MAG: polysaccharide deacetylase family protein [Acidobacteriia bacterium]|nr:polysaccharide deacetylase family protein [Terriglobia bacterium]